MSPDGGSKPKFDVGGQAVIEGVMMRGPQGYVTAVRLASTDAIEVREVPYQPLGKRVKPLGWPVIRGAVGMIEMMIIGIKTLNHSANTVAEDEERAERARKIAEGEEVKEPREQSALTRAALTATLVITLVFAMALFVAIPNLPTHCLRNFGEVRTLAAEHSWGHALWELAQGGGLDFQEYESPLRYNLLAGCVRIGIFLLYIWAISLMREIRRVFQYHGAEHMAIKTYEAGEPLDVAHARVKSRVHPRCGTTFLFLTALIAILVFSVMTRIMVAQWPWLTTIHWWALKGILIATHIVFMPLVAGLGYEIIKWGGKRPRHPIVRPLIAPGLLFQRITTRPPDDAMLEVALLSLERAVAMGEDADKATGAIY